MEQFKRQDAVLDGIEITKRQLQAKTAQFEIPIMKKLTLLSACVQSLII